MAGVAFTFVTCLWTLTRGAQGPWFNTLRNSISARHKVLFFPCSVSASLRQHHCSHSLTLCFKSCLSSSFLSSSFRSGMCQCCPVLGAENKLCLVLRWFQSPGHPESCLCPSLGMKHSTTYRRTEFALVGLTSPHLLAMLWFCFQENRTCAGLEVQLQIHHEVHMCCLFSVV